MPTKAQLEDRIRKLEAAVDDARGTIAELEGETDATGEHTCSALEARTATAESAAETLRTWLHDTYGPLAWPKDHPVALALAELEA